MREIKFRGRRPDGAWCYGSLYMAFGEIHAPNDIPIMCFIIDLTGQHHPVDPKTVGEFTGLHDKNGKEIYEGDIICGYCSNGSRIIHVIEYDTEEGKYNANQRWIDSCGKEVIGNVHENPELLNVH